MQNETGNVSTTVAASPSNTELCKEYTNAIFYGFGMSPFAVCKYKERIIYKERKKER